MHIFTFLSYLLRDLIGYHTALVASRERVVAASRVRVDQKDPNQRVESPRRAVHLPPLGVMMDGGVSLLTVRTHLTISLLFISHISPTIPLTCLLFALLLK